MRPKTVILALIIVFAVCVINSGCNNVDEGRVSLDLKNISKGQENWQNKYASGFSTSSFKDRFTQRLSTTDTLPNPTSTLASGFLSYDDLVIVIDPGHGNPGNPGAAGASGVIEKDIVLDISYRLKSLLERDGFKVVMTRTGSETVLGNPERAEVANKNKADLFIRIHADSDKNPAIGGTRTLWYRDDSFQIAQIIQRELAKSTGLADLGVRRQYLVGFYYSKVPSVAVEVAYLSNPAEEKLLADPSFQQKSADGIYSGIVAYFDWLRVFRSGIETSTLP